MKDQRHVPAAFYPGKDLVPIVQEARWAPGPVWTGAENFAPNGIFFQDSKRLFKRNRSPAYKMKYIMNTWNNSHAQIT
jgi:hypothetical protein